MDCGNSVELPAQPIFFLKPPGKVRDSVTFCKFPGCDAGFADPERDPSIRYRARFANPKY